MLGESPPLVGDLIVALAAGKLFLVTSPPFTRTTIMNGSSKSLPQVVSREEWQKARDALLVKEKAHTRAGDALAAERRRLPMVKIEKNYVFEGRDGKASLVDLFDGRKQLIVYHFMFRPTDDEGCGGCSWVVDNICDVSHLHARDVSFVLVSRAPQAKLKPFQERMGWNLPWFSSFGTDFNIDFGLTNGDKETPGISVFLRDGDCVYHTYFTTSRGVEGLGSLWTYLDLTPYGRQETWEDSPDGWPQTPPMKWLRRHDSYVQAPKM